MASPSRSARASTYPPVPNTLPPIVLAIGGSDSSAGAGVQADVKAVAAHGAYARTVVTAITAQSSRGVHASEAVSAALVAQQIAAAYEDEPPTAVKTGMLANAEIVEAVASALQTRRPRWLVVDPVLRSSSGAALIDADGAEALRARLLPLADLVTPNAAEAEALTGLTVHSLADAEAAGRGILALGPRAVLVKGGHLARNAGSDVLVTAEGVRVVAGTWQADRDVHGTGCAYASAIAALLAQDCALDDAIERAKRYLDTLIATAVRVGDGALMPQHFASNEVAS
jgi:hydroxymethylpyrimidine/phosphomethylpyrimidine kinase